MTGTRVVMSACAAALALLGLAGTFLPVEIVAFLGAPESAALTLLVQVTGALYLGFAALDWMARDNLIGGIYGRPVAIGNMMHFLVAGLAMVRHVIRAPDNLVLWAIALAYAAFAAWFGMILFRHPITDTHSR